MPEGQNIGFYQRKWYKRLQSKTGFLAKKNLQGVKGVYISCRGSDLKVVFFNFLVESRAAYLEHAAGFGLVTFHLA